MNYHEKYIKYKNKYLQLKQIYISGAGVSNMYTIKFISRNDPNINKYLNKSAELTISCFGFRSGYDFLPQNMPGIIVCLENKTDEFDIGKIIGILCINDEFNKNRKLKWWRGSENNPISTNSEHNHKYFEISNLCVNKKYRSEGIGSLLLNSAKKLGDENGFDYMFAKIDIDDETERRIKFYQNNNFNEYQITDYKKQPDLKPKPTEIIYISDMQEIQVKIKDHPEKSTHVKDIDKDIEDIVIKHIPWNSPEFEKVIKHDARKLLSKCFGIRIDDPFELVGKIGPGIVVSYIREKLIGIIIINDDFNDNKELKWYGGTSNKPNMLVMYKEHYKKVKEIHTKDPEYDPENNTEKLEKCYFSISILCIHEDYWNKKIGSKMLNYVKQLGRDNGFNCIFTNLITDLVGSSKVYQLLPFFNKNGFNLRFDNADLDTFHTTYWAEDDILIRSYGIYDYILSCYL